MGAGLLRRLRTPARRRRGLLTQCGSRDHGGQRAHPVLRSAQGRADGLHFARVSCGRRGRHLLLATIPEERGKGLGAHATAEPLRLVRELGYGVGVLQSSPAGHSVYRKLGFADVGEVPLYVKMPVGS